MSNFFEIMKNKQIFVFLLIRSMNQNIQEESHSSGRGSKSFHTVFFSPINDREWAWKEALDKEKRENEALRERERVRQAQCCNCNRCLLI